MKVSNPIEVRNIVLPAGGNLMVEITPEFLVKVRQHFMLSDDQTIDDDHIRMFLYGSIDSALNKIEND